MAEIKAHIAQLKLQNYPDKAEMKLAKLRLSELETEYSQLNISACQIERKIEDLHRQLLAPLTKQLVSAGQLEGATPSAPPSQNEVLAFFLVFIFPFFDFSNSPQHLTMMTMMTMATMKVRTLKVLHLRQALLLLHLDPYPRPRKMQEMGLFSLCSLMRITFLTLLESFPNRRYHRPRYNHR